MKLAARRVLFSGLVLLLLLPGSRAIRAQENDLSRILRPLPDYDPFDKPPPTPEFFPDEVDKRVREALIDSLTNQTSKLEDHARFFVEKDAELKRSRGTVTGLTDYVVDLYDSSISDRKSYLEAQQKALTSASPQQRKVIESRLRNDELKRAEELSHNSTFNHLGGMVNKFLASVDLVSILSGSYIAAAVDAALTQVLTGSKGMSEEDRRALVLYREYLKRNPEDPKNEEIRKRVEILEKKQKENLVAKELEKAGEALRKRNLNEAAFHYELAALIEPESKDAQVGLENVQGQLAQEKEHREKGLSVVADPAREPQGIDAELLYALALRQPEAIAAKAAELEKDNPGRPLGDSAMDASAVALEIEGKHEQATKLLQKISQSSASKPDRQRAELLLKDPDYNMLGSFQAARTQHKLDTIKFVLLGDDFLKKNLLVAAVPMITYGAAGATTLGAANAIMLGTNLLSVLTANPVSSQDIVDKGVSYIRTHPESENAAQVYRVLAEAYEKAGMYDRALTYYELAGEPAQAKVAELKEKAAKAFLAAAEKTRERDAQRLYLKTILDYYPESPEAQEATKKLAQLAKVENQGIRLSKKFLMENPELYGAGGLRLKPSLFDGDPRNMELADLGLNILSDRQVLLHFASPWGVQSQTYAVDKEVLDNLQVTLRKKNYDLALQDVNTRPSGSPGGFASLPKSLLQGDWSGKKAPAVDQADLNFRREVGGPSADSGSSPDYEFLAPGEGSPNQGLKLPPMQGSIGARGFNLGGTLPAGFWGDRLAIGTDEKSPYASLQFPIPLLQGFIPIDFLFQGRPGRFAVFPQIHMKENQAEDKELFR
jgi:tetratricopeptide (TPR) repeat protein